MIFVLTAIKLTCAPHSIFLHSYEGMKACYKRVLWCSIHIYAYGYYTLAFQVMIAFMPPPPSATYLAFHPQDSNKFFQMYQDKWVGMENLFELKRAFNHYMPRQVNS